MKDMVEEARTFLILYHRKPFHWLHASDEEVITELTKLWQAFMSYVILPLLKSSKQ